jgi:glycosyltransferase involved in cell wall biosynthesis
MMEKIDAIVCPSKFLHDKMVEAGYNRDRLHHVPSFIDHAQYTPSTTPGSYVLYFGRISREKGVDVLVDAFARLRSSSSIRLIIVGLGSRESLRALREKIQTAQLPNVQLQDPMSGETLFTTIRNAACVVVPSICYENMPQVVLESYAHGKPVIASNLGSLPEVVEDRVTGSLFQAGNADDLAEKIGSLASDKERLRRMGQAALEKVRSGHSPEIHYQALMSLFSQLRKDL